MTKKYKELEEKINNVVHRDKQEDMAPANLYKLRPGVSDLDKDTGERVFSTNKLRAKLNM